MGEKNHQKLGTTARVVDINYTPLLQKSFTKLSTITFKSMIIYILGFRV